MKDEKPDDRLPVLDLPSTSKTEPGLYALERDGARWRLSRRDFLTASVAAAAAAASQTAHAQVVCTSALAHTSAVRALAITPDGRTLASGGDDKIVKFWKVPQGAHYKSAPQAEVIWSSAIDPEGQLLVLGCGDKTVKLCSLSDGTVAKTLTGHAEPVYAVAISSDGRLLASDSGDRTIRL
jgi:WD40 repeat protein